MHPFFPQPASTNHHSTNTCGFSPSGLFTYTVLNSLIWIIVTISGGSITPEKWEAREFWTWKPAGRKPLLFRLFSKHQEWKEHKKNAAARKNGDNPDPVVDDDPEEEDLGDDDNESTARLRDPGGGGGPGRASLAESPVAGNNMTAGEREEKEEAIRVIYHQPFRTAGF